MNTSKFWGEGRQEEQDFRILIRKRGPTVTLMTQYQDLNYLYLPVLTQSEDRPEFGLQLCRELDQTQYSSDALILFCSHNYLCRKYDTLTRTKSQIPSATEGVKVQLADYSLPYLTINIQLIHK